MKFFFILIFLLPVIIIFGNKELLGQYQYKINENFEGTVFPPQGWSVKNIVAGQGEWKISNRMTNLGNGCAVSNFTQTGSNNYLVSKRFIPALGDSLILYFKQTFWINYKDTFNVYVTNVDSLFNGNKTKLLNLIDNVNYPSPSFYGRKAVSLNAFAGQTIWLGFQHINLDGDNIRLDDICVRQKDFPVIYFSALTNINNISNRNLSGVTITDFNGIDTSSAMRPRIYFKKSQDANTLTGWKFAKSNNNSSPFEFTINYSLLNGLAYGDTIQYFVVAQDMDGSVSINSGSFASQPANVSLTSAAFPIGGVINSYRINDAPSIFYASLSATNGLSNRVLSNVSITDPDGIDISPGMKPKIYFKPANEVNTFIDNSNLSEGWKFTESNNSSSPFEFTIDYTLLNALAYGDTIQYFIVAQDNQGAVSINSGSFASQTANVSLTSEAFPIGGTINSYKINDVPSISCAALTNTNDISNRVLSNVVITDSDGIETTSGLKPRVYFKKSADDNNSDSWKFTEATNNASPFEFTIDYALLNGLAYGDTIQYFIVAQDNQGAVSINSGSFASQPANVSLTTSSFPIVGTINSYKINDVPSISCAALTNTNDISNRVLSNVLITDADGIETTSGLKPRVYFKKSADNNNSVSWKFTEATNNVSPFEFNIDYALLNGLSYGDTIQYFVIAQDIESSVSINSGSFASQPANVSLTSEAFPIGGTINLYKINGAPSISYTTLANTNDISNRVLSNVVITDADGIETTSGLKPRVYFKKSADDNNSVSWKFTEATNNASPFEFTIDYALLNGLAYGDTIQYFIVAQDNQGAVSINSGSFASQPANVSLTSASFPISGTINSYKINGAPSISCTALTNTNDISNRILSNVVITDSEGIETTPGLKPRVYFKKSADDNNSVSWKFTEATNNVSPFEFTIDYALLNGLSYGDTIQYFVIAQDIESSVSINSGSFASQPANVSLTSASFPISGTINSFKINGAPSISYSALADTNNISNRVLSNVVITDSEGIETTPGLKPRVYFKKSADDNNSASWKFTEATNNVSPFEFNIDYTLLNGLSYGDTIQYFVIAQDIESSVSINSGSFASQTENVSLTSASFPIGGAINSYEISGISDVGIESNIFPAGTLSSCLVDNFIPKAMIRNFSTSSQIIPFEITYSITGSVNYLSVKRDTLYAGYSKIISFDSVIISDTGSYNTKVFTSLASDQNRQNDTLVSTFSITNSNFGGGLSDNGGYYFSNSIHCNSRSESQPEFCWKDTSGSKNLILNGQNVSQIPFTGNIDDGYFSLGNILQSGNGIRFYNRDYDSIYISTNGIISFTKKNLLLTGDPVEIINADTSQFSFFAPLLSDFDFGNNLVNENRLSYKVAGNQLIITYDKVPVKSGSPSDYVSFQICIQTGNDLNQNSNLLVQYNEQSTGYDFITNYNANTLPSHFIGMKNDNGNCLIYRLNDSNGVTINGPMFNSSLALQVGMDIHSLFNKCSQTQVRVLLEGIYPEQDTVTLFLRDSKYPYTKLESKKIFLDQAGNGTTVFTLPDESYKYYLSVKHRNSIETWSKDGGTDFKAFSRNYDFSTDSTQAYGNNMKMSGGQAYFYSGDVNADNTVDGNDLIIIFNDVSYYRTGYVLTDLNNDRVVDLGDLILGFNNNIRFITTISP